MKVRNVNNWKELALNRKAWNDLVDLVKNPPNGLLCHSYLIYPYTQYIDQKLT